MVDATHSPDNDILYMIIYVLEYSTDQQVSLDRPAKAGENGLVWGSMERGGLIADLFVVFLSCHHS